jgi:hypothetical protein
MEDYTRHYFDERQYASGTLTSEHHVRTYTNSSRPIELILESIQLEDFTIQKPDGTIVKGRDDATKANQEIYAPFAAHHHVPDFLVCWETDDGWGMTGTIHSQLTLTPRTHLSCRRSKLLLQTPRVARRRS